MHAAVLVCLVFGMACGRQGVSEGAAPLERETVYVHVVNDNYYSARIRAFYDGGNQFIIGVVESNTTADQFEIPWQNGALRFEVDLVAGPGKYLSTQVFADPGDIVQLQLPPNIEESGFFRRIRD